MLFLVSSLTFQITLVGAEPLASMNRPFHIFLPFHNTTTQVTLRTQEQVSHTIPSYHLSGNLCSDINTSTTVWLQTYSLLTTPARAAPPWMGYPLCRPATPSADLHESLPLLRGIIIHPLITYLTLQDDRDGCGNSLWPGNNLPAGGPASHTPRRQFSPSHLEPDSSHPPRRATPPAHPWPVPPLCPKDQPCCLVP